MGQALRLLLVDDDRVDREEVRRALRKAGVKADLQEVSCFMLGLEALRGRSYDCALLDFRLPSGNAFEMLEKLGEEARRRSPIIVLTGLEDEELGLQLVAAGAQDYLVKGDVDPQTLLRSIRYAIERHKIQEALQDAKARLEEMSNQDPLTQLLNRRGLAPILALEVARAERRAEPLLVLLVDCDNFKKVNETFGYGVGDKVLERVARVLKEATRSTDHLARIGGDEFLVLLPESRISEAVAVGERICRDLRHNSIELPTSAVQVTASIAVVAVPAAAQGLGDVLAAAHVGLHRIKREGKDRVIWVDPADSRTTNGMLDRASLEEAVSAHGSIRVFSQPVLALEGRERRGEELLVRGPNGLESPEHLLAAAHELDAVAEVDLRCLKRIVETLADVDSGVPVHLNLCPRTLLSTPAEELLEILSPSSHGRKLLVDISTRWILGDPAQLRAALDALRRGGVEIALDHVGFGHSSLEALLLLSPRSVKTDPRVVRGVSADPGRAHLIRRLLSVTRSLEADLVALGIETDADLDTLRKLGVVYGQGFALAKPRQIECRA